MTAFIKVGDIMEQYIIALILGVIEGITECIPVSSTGHMIIIGNMLNFEGAHADVFEVFIQIGASRLGSIKCSVCGLGFLGLALPLQGAC